MQIAREAGLDVRGGDILPHYRGGVSEGYLDLIDAAYAAGAEKGKEAYEREHLRHTVPLPDALRAMQDQVAEACAKAANEACATNRVLIAIRSEWRKYWDSK